jgi:hypothetical protein
MIQSLYECRELGFFFLDTTRFERSPSLLEQTNKSSMTTETFYEKHAILDHTYIPGRLTYQVDSHTKDSAYHHNNYTGKGKGHYKDDWKGGKARKGLEGAERIIRKKGIPISYLFIVHCTVEIVICAGVSGLFVLFVEFHE